MAGAAAMLIGASGSMMTTSGSSSVSVTNQNILSTAPLTANAIAGYRLNTSGIAEKRVGSVYTTLETWLLSGTAASYDVRVTVVSGTLSSGTTGSWLNLGTTREWYCSDGTSGDAPVEATLLVEISNTGAATAIDNATVFLSSERS